MPVAIYVDPDAATSDVILVEGQCYKRAEDSDHPAEVTAEDITSYFDDCAECGCTINFFIDGSVTISGTPTNVTVSGTITGPVCQFLQGTGQNTIMVTGDGSVTVNALSFVSTATSAGISIAINGTATACVASPGSVTFSVSMGDVLGFSAIATNSGGACGTWPVADNTITFIDASTCEFCASTISCSILNLADDTVYTMCFSSASLAVPTIPIVDANWNDTVSYGLATDFAAAFNAMMASGSMHAASQSEIAYYIGEGVPASSCPGYAFPPSPSWTAGGVEYRFVMCYFN